MAAKASRVSRVKNKVSPNSKLGLVSDSSSNPAVNPETDPASDCDSDLQAKIAELAYHKAESRGFAPGREMEDWLEAERELTESGD